MLIRDRGNEVFPSPAGTAGHRLAVLALLTLLAIALSGTSTSSCLADEASPDRLGPMSSPGPSSDPRAFFTPEEIATWKQYRLRKIWTHLIGLGSMLLFYLVLIATGLNRALKRLAERSAEWCYTHPFLNRIGRRWPLLARVVKAPEILFGGRQWLGVLFYCVFFLFLLRLVFFPQHFYRTYWYDLQHGLSNYTLGLWFLDYAKGLLTGTLLFALMVFGIYGLMARVGSRWWLLLWVGVSVAIFGYVAVAPYGSHLYSDFRPLESGELRDRLEDLATQTGLPLEDVLVVDASRRTKKVNAYLSGAGPSERIVLYDNLVETFTPREITMIMAHELAHWKEPDERRSYAVFSVTVFLVLALANFILKRGTRFRRLHYTSPMDVAGLPVLFLTFFIAFEVLRPVNLTWKRAREIKADRMSLELVCDPEAFITTHVKLARLNYADVAPHPLQVVFFASHPPFRERVEVALGAECEGGNLSPSGL
jgi:STE24 endopeptidase